jgi:hypothetical protein
VGGIVPLGRWATVVGELAVAGGVGTVKVQQCGERSTGPVTLSTGSFVVTRVSHLCGSLVFESNNGDTTYVRNLRCDIVHPLSPDILVRLIEHARISTERSTKVRNLASRDRNLIVGVLVARRKVAAGAVVALVNTLDTALNPG